MSDSASVGMPVISSTSVTVSLGTLASGDGVNLTIELDRAPGAMTNRTEVTASGGDANPADNAVVLTTPAVVPPTLVLAAASGSGFRMAFGTRADCNDVLDQTGRLDPPAWTTLAVLSGTGSERVIELPIPTDPMAFYRLRIE